MRFTCPACGFSTDVEHWPFTCACRRKYASATAEPALPANRNTTPAPAEGPGTELKAMLAEIGAKPTAACSCKSMMAKMNRWGVEGCRTNRGEIVVALRSNAEKMSLLGFASASLKSLSASWWGAIRPTDRWGSLVDEAIRRAEAKACSGS